jgi:2-dehydropantoate 2-reductase
VRVSHDAVDRSLTALGKVPADATTSLQRDLVAGRPSELPDQCGAVVRLGRTVGVDTPLHDIVFHCLLPQERAAREAAGIPLPSGHPRRKGGG